MATNMEKTGRKSANRPGENEIKIEAHFVSLQEDALYETIDSLASMIYEYLKGGESDE